MNNEMIGITGVFALTFFFLVLRHYLLSIGRSTRNLHVEPTAPLEHYELTRKAVEDGSWLLWSPDHKAGSQTASNSEIR